ncbi:MAG: bifunctional phosphopantothenoylcysteine decarboxylase/phosphopantothenate--cysteine ligase CoaBC [Bacteroidetes bacterium]|nr:bifunctional phosphopantothenoylcysteine decarboxylase/phosphopantothenate--cysteine ligase CoaBC [Bacteroidota bacterium]
MLRGKKILLGITGSIAAYKSAVLTRLFVKEGAAVKVIMTPCANDFITPLTLSTLSKNPVHLEFYSATDGTWNNHVELGLWADVMIIAPASANTIAKMAAGLCDNLLLAAYLSARCPVYIAPAMDLDMLKHSATKNNITKLKSFRNTIIAPDTGELASGLHGEGRMAEPETIVEFISGELKKKAPLNGKTALVTAGPTYEAIDPVRFIGNHSSGKMGFAIAEELARQGAEVVLISGPTMQTAGNTSIRLIHVTSAKEMLDECLRSFPSSDVVVMSAAVSDYTPSVTAKQKIKKKGDDLAIKLKPTTDILAELGRKKKASQVLVGFALETNNELEHAKEKLKKKKLDFIVLNSLKDKGAGFKGDTNKITIIDKNNKTTKFELKDKKEVARDVVKKIIDFI